VTFDVNRVRAADPALSDGYAYLDGAAGTQVPVPVIEAVADAYRAGLVHYNDQADVDRLLAGVAELA
jgi:selenocysteine lyase/cysteine desulfurase